ncbi:MAG: hypothetical protein M3O82_05340, partial [Verrucomicrobiota bacterium]|nr:hypothetical protein [Verrucomicrobiota bacterium]
MRDLLLTSLRNDLKLLLSTRCDDDSVPVRTTEFGGAAIHRNASQLALYRKPQFEIYFRRRLGSGEFNLPYDRASFKRRLQCEA